MAASMGAFLLTAGAKGKRSALPHSRVMIHQPLGGAQGQASDIEITAREILKTKRELYEILAAHSGVSVRKIEKDADRVIVGNYMPDFYYGFSVNLSYKGFDLAANFQGVYGNEILNLERRYLLNMEASSNMMKESLQRYPYGELNRATRKSSGNNGACTSTFHLEDGSYLRLQNLSLGYTFPDRWTRKAGISKLRIYVQGTNLFTWTDYSGYNPEVNKRSTDALRPGEDYCSYPLSRTFSVGVNFNL